MLKNELDHECYYSISDSGSSLARHMDERHEETKGPRGWLLPSRRSLSWLIYLSVTDDGSEWDANRNGGLLRTFSQNNEFNSDIIGCGSHNGNLQVGWLIPSNNADEFTHPVFLNSWYDTAKPYRLYTAQMQNGEEIIEYISVPWSIDDMQGGNVAAFMQQRAQMESKQRLNQSLFVKQLYAKRFNLLEDRVAWRNGYTPRDSVVEDYVPTRGTLVVFDSVTLPHEVTPVIAGKRAALAGWFHEATQPLGGGPPS